jgi:hypothetical protein
MISVALLLAIERLFSSKVSKESAAKLLQHPREERRRAMTPKVLLKSSAIH